MLIRKNTASCRLRSFGTLSMMAIMASAFSQPAPEVPKDPTEPLRRFPISFLVNRPGTDGVSVSMLRLDSIHPKDDLEIKVDPDLAQKWTFVAATVAAGQRVHVQSWDLWDKKWKNNPVNVGKVPGGDVVPLFFLVLNKNREHNVANAVTHALETSAGQLISQTASFESIYQQQNRLLNFMSAYAALGPKQYMDPVGFKVRVADIDADLGIPYDPNVQQSQPGDFQHGLDAGIGILSTIRQAPDDPAAAAAMAQQQLPSIVSDWVGLVGDLMHIFVKPPHQVKLTFIPTSATEADSSFTKGHNDPEDWMQLMTERVLDTSGDSLPALVFRPNYTPTPPPSHAVLQFDSPEVLTSGASVAVPLAANCRDLYLHPWTWDWEYSGDGKTYQPLEGAHLVPGQGLVFPTSDKFWAGGTVKDVDVRAHYGFDMVKPFHLKIARAYPQKWAADEAEQDVAAGDKSAVVHMVRAGTVQPFYHFADVRLIDSAGKSIPATGTSYDGKLAATFDLSAAAPGKATLHVDQVNASLPDQSATVFVEPRHPAIELYCGKGDKVLRVSGPDAGFVKSVAVANLFVTESDDTEPANRRLTLSGALPDAARSAVVTYHDPATGLEWTRPVPVAIGLPRPKVKVALKGSLPTTVMVGAGSAPSWAEATLPPGWFPTNLPVRIQLQAVKPFSWTHDLHLTLGFGSAGDVQPVTELPEGPTFSMDQDSADAYVTLTMDTSLPTTAKRNTGLLWFQATRSDLSSPWMLATANEVPMRAIKLPTVQAVETIPTGIRITLSNADDILGVKFTGTTNVVLPQLLKSSPAGLVATIDGPVGATEFDLQIRDATDGAVHIKLMLPKVQALPTPSGPVPTTPVTPTPVPNPSPVPAVTPTTPPVKTPGNTQK